MQLPLERYTESHRVEALNELRSELADFNFDGLIQLVDDLAENHVIRGSWAGCVISYKRGAPGSARRDRLGRARNAFTVLWDNGWLTDEEVLGLVRAEISLRHNEIQAVPRVDRAPEFC